MITVVRSGVNGFESSTAVRYRYTAALILAITYLLLLLAFKSIIHKRNISCLLIASLFLFLSRIHYKEIQDSREKLTRGMKSYLLEEEITSLAFLYQENARMWLDEATEIGYYKFKISTIFPEIKQKKKIQIETKNDCTLKYWIDIIKYKNDFLYLKGWSFIEEQNTENQKIFVVLKSPDKQYVFNTRIMKRPDITKHFSEILENTRNLDQGGFEFGIDCNEQKLPKGKYKIGLFVTKNKNMMCYNLTEKEIVIQ